jgi:hypothetical protein
LKLRRRTGTRIAGGTLIALLTGCAPPPPPPAAVRDKTKDAWYAQTVERLAAMDREAEGLVQSGKRDTAAAVIQRAEPLMNKVLAVPRPTLAATVAASDLDQLYGRMLLENRHYGWARLEFQKNLSRWKHWQPRTADAERRLAQARAAIAECDRHLPP